MLRSRYEKRISDVILVIAQYSNVLPDYLIKVMIRCLNALAHWIENKSR